MGRFPMSLDSLFDDLRKRVGSKSARQLHYDGEVDYLLSAAKPETKKQVVGLCVSLESIAFWKICVGIVKCGQDERTDAILQGYEFYDLALRSRYQASPKKITIQADNVAFYGDVPLVVKTR